MTIKALPVRQLQIAMILDEDVRTTNGAIVISKGEELHAVHLTRLGNFARGIGIVEPIRIRIP